jgi:Ni/Co efflux regulator RcnB
VVDYRPLWPAGAARGYQYTRVDNDVVLTAVATGMIASVIVGLFQ